MANMERATAAAPAMQPTPQTQSDLENLPALFGRLADDVVKLLDTKLSLVKVEMKEDAAVYARGGAMIGAGAILATVGLALLNVAIAFFISLLFSFSSQPLNYACGFLITGALYLIIGGAVIYSKKKSLAAYNPVPNRSVEELRKDKQWLKNGI